MYEWESSRQTAQDNYRATNVQMHPVTSAMLAKDLHLVWSFLMKCLLIYHLFMVALQIIESDVNENFHSM